MTTYAATGDERLLAWENAAALSDLLNEALTVYAVKHRRGRTPDLDDDALVMVSESDVVLGERGTRLLDRRVRFTYRQVMNMADMLGALLPFLAAEAHAARVDHERAN